jgi:TolB protein
MDTDGNNQQQLARGCVSYFSPDGSQILYGIYCSDTDDLWLMNSDGSNQHPITKEQECRNATWSPDGSKIVFEQSNSGKDGPFAQYIMSLDNPDPSNWFMLTGYDIDGRSPVWQP